MTGWGEASSICLQGSLEFVVASGVHLSAKGRPPRDRAVAVRARPRQSRARFTAEALQDAFVQVLVEHGYAKTTVREVADVAGVSVGSFYRYFGNMRTLAARCISDAAREAEREAREAVEPLRGEPIANIVEVLVDRLVRSVMGNARVWRALIRLERTVSAEAAFRSHYDAYVSLWADALALADKPPPEDQRNYMARMLHMISYGWLSQILLTLDEPPSRRLRIELNRAIQGYLALCVSPAMSDCPSP